MARPPRRDILDHEGVYHVIVRGNNKMTLFRDAADYGKYEGLLRVLKTRFGVSFLSYVIMPNHAHLLLSPGSDFSHAMQTVQTNYAKHFCSKYGHIGHVWQGRYKSLRVDTDEYLWTVARYIEMNPIRAGLAKIPEEWPYSSCVKSDLVVPGKFLP